MDGSRKHDPVEMTNSYEDSCWKVSPEQASRRQMGHPDWDQPDATWTPEGIGEKSKGTRQVSPEEFFGRHRVQELNRISLPADLRVIVGAPEGPIPVDSHVLEEAVPGGKHEETRWHAEHLQDVIDHWSLWGESPARKIENDAARWEVYTRISHEYWILVILGTSRDRTSYRVVTMYLAKTQTIKNRMNGNIELGIPPHLKRRSG